MPTLFFYLIGYTDGEHRHLMGLLQTTLSPGTWRNHERHATRYIARMRARELNHLAPTAYDVAHYTASLHRDPPSPASVANTLSGAHAWYREAGASDTAFAAPLVDLVKRCTDRVFARVPRPALSVTPEMLHILLRHCGRFSHCGRGPWATFALTYFTLMRKSNLLSSALGVGAARTPSGGRMSSLFQVACGSPSLHRRPSRPAPRRSPSSAHPTPTRHTARSCCGMALCDSSLPPPVLPPSSR